MENYAESRRPFVNTILFIANGHMLTTASHVFGAHKILIIKTTFPKRSAVGLLGLYHYPTPIAVKRRNLDNIISPW